MPLTLPDLQVHYCLWAPNYRTNVTAERQLTFQDEHSAYFEALRAEGAIREFTPQSTLGYVEGH